MSRGTSHLYCLRMICFNGMVIPMLTGATLEQCRERVKKRIDWYLREFADANGAVDELEPGYEWECTQDGLVGDYDGYLKIEKFEEG